MSREFDGLARRDPMEIAAPEESIVVGRYGAGSVRRPEWPTVSGLPSQPYRRSMAHITTRPASSLVGNTGTLFDRPQITDNDIRRGHLLSLSKNTTS